MSSSGARSDRISPQDILTWCATLPWWEAAAEIATALRRAACPFSFIGGAVRDAVRAIVCGERPAEIGDLDITVEQDVFDAIAAVARRSPRLAGATVRRHPAFLTMSILLPGGVRIDLARARSERYVRPGALPIVTPAGTTEDIRRRDFTVNAVGIRWEPSADRYELLDPSNGIDDIRRRLLRVFHPASFRDDPTRVLRAARFAAALGYAVERQTLTWLRAAVHSGALQTVSSARTVSEFRALLRKGTHLDVAAALLRRWGAATCFGPAGPLVAWFIQHAVSLEFPGLAPTERYRCRLLALAIPLARREGIPHGRALRQVLSWCAVPHAERTELYAAARALDGGSPLPSSARWFVRACEASGVHLAPPLIGARDLLEMGYGPGLHLGETLRAIRQAQERGTIRTPAQARRFAAQRLLRLRMREK